MRRENGSGIEEVPSELKALYLDSDVTEKVDGGLRVVHLQEVVRFDNKSGQYGGKQTSLVRLGREGMV